MEHYNTASAACDASLGCQTGTCSCIICSCIACGSWIQLLLGSWIQCCATFRCFSCLLIGLVFPLNNCYCVINVLLLVDFAPVTLSPQLHWAFEQPGILELNFLHSNILYILNYKIWTKFVNLVCFAPDA